MKSELINRRKFTFSLTSTAAARSVTTFDLVVIGAGVFGAWIAYRCMKRGLSVMLLDCRGPGNSSSSSGDESRILRIGYGEETIYSRWALHSMYLWRKFLDSVGGTHLFLKSGVLWIGPENNAYLNATIKTLGNLQTKIEVFKGSALRRRFPQIKGDADSIGILEQESGAVLARRAVQLLVDVGVRQGIVYQTSLVLPPRIEGDLTSIVTSSGESIRARNFVYACGPWLPKMFPDVIARLIRVTRQEVFFFAVPPGNQNYRPSALPAWVDFSADRIFYGLPNIEGRGVKAAADKHGREIDPDLENRMPTAEGLAAVREFLHIRFPEIGGSPCVETRVCQYENTASGDFLIDQHPRARNVWIVGGGSGHGFKHGPAIGYYVASLLEGKKPDPTFSLKTARMNSARLVH